MAFTGRKGLGSANHAYAGRLLGSGTTLPSPAGPDSATHALSLRQFTKTYKNGVPTLFVLASLAAAAVLFAVQVSQFFFLSDDSYITFRYVRHVAQGFGPVWNPGERVEGYSSPLWLVLTALSLKLGWRLSSSLPSVGSPAASRRCS